LIRLLLQVSIRFPRKHLPGGALADPLFTAAAAAKINAQLQAKKGIQHVDVPPIRSSAPDADKAPGDPDAASTINGEMYIADGDYIKDIEINDLRNRYLLTKGSTQHMVITPFFTDHIDNSKLFTELGNRVPIRFLLMSRYAAYWAS
jgi:hypothetical protein